MEQGTRYVNEIVGESETREQFACVICFVRSLYQEVYH